jgi:hypothetical protein
MCCKVVALPWLTDVLVEQVTVEISYLKSYENMGQAQVECVEGCTCEITILEGHTADKTSLVR